MAKLAGTVTSTGSNTNREQLDDLVSMITPEDTPIYTMLKKTSAKNTHEDWAVDELETPSSNAHLEGNEYDFDAIGVPERLGNICQIFTKTLAISKTQEAVEDAGNRVKMAAKKLQKGVELRKDVEFALLQNTASRDESGNNARLMGSLASFYETNVSRGTGGANGGYDANTKKTVAATAGTQRAFTQGQVDDVLQSVYINGGSVKKIVCAPHVMSVFKTFRGNTSDGVVEQRQTNNSHKIVSAAKVYVGQFGEVSLVPNRVQAGDAVMASNIHFIDPRMVGMKVLRKIAEDKDLAKTGDKKSAALVGEMMLCVKNEKGLGVIADVYGLSATS